MTTQDDLRNCIADIQTAITGVDALDADIVARDAVIASRDLTIADLQAQLDAFKSESHVAFGCSIASFEAFQAALGVPLQAKRIYAASSAPSTWQAPAAPVRAIIDTLLYDAVSLTTAHSKLATYPVRPIVTYDAEPERTTGQTAAQYVARHQAVYAALHDVADIAWNPMAYSFHAGVSPDARGWYPGDGFVDLIAVDGYAKPNSMPYPTPDAVFGDSLIFCRQHGKPYAIFEFGVRVNTSGSTSAARAAWINDFHAWAKATTELRYALYWESGPPIVTSDYRIEGDAVVMAAFRNMVDDLG